MEQSTEYERLLDLVVGSKTAEDVDIEQWAKKLAEDVKDLYD